MGVYGQLLFFRRLRIVDGLAQACGIMEGGRSLPGVSGDGLNGVVKVIV